MSDATRTEARPKLKPAERKMLDRIIRASGGTLLMAVIYGESRAAIRRLDRLLFLGLVERCGHATIKEGPFPAPAVRATDAGRRA